MNLLIQRIRQREEFYSLLDKHEIIGKEEINHTTSITKIEATIKTNINQYNILAKLVKKLLKIDLMTIHISLVFDHNCNKITYVMTPIDTENAFTVKGVILLDKKCNILVNDSCIEGVKGNLKKFICRKIEQAVEDIISKDIEEILNILLL